MTWKVFVEHQPWKHFATRLHVVREAPGGLRQYIRTTFETYQEGAEIIGFDGLLGAVPGPPDEVREFLQAMSDAAWEMGIKPKQIEDNRNELKAVKDHLEDMRFLAKVRKDQRA